MKCQNVLALPAKGTGNEITVPVSNVTNVDVGITTNYVLNKGKCISKKIKACGKVNYDLERKSTSATVIKG